MRHPATPSATSVTSATQTFGQAAAAVRLLCTTLTAYQADVRAAGHVQYHRAAAARMCAAIEAASAGQAPLDSDSIREIDALGIRLGSQDSTPRGCDDADECRSLASAAHHAAKILLMHSMHSMH